jgi:PAS domain S-box-containing protein
LLRKSEEKHRLFFENAQAPFFQVQLENGLVLDCNIQGAQLFGFESPQDMIRKVRLSDFYYNPPDRLKLLRELKDKGTVKNYLLHLKKKDGLELWVEISSIPDFKEGTIAAVVIDVTNRKMAEDALKASEQRYRDFMNGMPVGIGISDLRERFIFANPIFCRMTGYSQDEMEKMKTLDIVAPEEHKKILTETQLRASGEPSVYETRLIRKDGTEFAVSISAAPYRNELNVVIGTIALVADVTVSKQTEAAMKVSETRLKSLIEQLPVGVVIADFDERIELVNQALSEIFWRKREVLIGTKLTEYLSPESILKIKRETMGRIDGIKSTYDITVIRADGVNRDVRVWGAPNYNNYGEAIGTLGVFEDITEQKRNETIRKRQEQEIDLYSSLLRHDLKNDLGLIRNYIEAVEMLLKSADEEATSFLNSAISAVERMTDLLNTFGKPQTMREIDIVDFISEVAGESQKAQKSLRINVAYSANTTPANITAGGLLALVFMNLFRNAAQHAGMNPEIDVKVSKTDTMISVIVSDDGPGIAEELKSKLFTRGASGKGEAGGLGLYLSKEIMERTGGSIELVPGKKGATFLLKIPIQA